MQTLARTFALAALAALPACGGAKDEMAGADTGAEGQTTSGTSFAASLDPAPGFNTPGSFTCDGCPDSDLPFDPLAVGAVTASSFSGLVTGAVGNGEFYVVTDDGSRAVGGTIATDPNTGSFSFVAPLYCGTQLIKCVWSNEEGTYVLVTEVVAEECVEPDIRATLTWDDLGADWELHLVKEGGQINDPETDCTWNTCIPSGPDWGVVGDDSDNPAKDVDNTGSYGPENIFLGGAEPGLYTVMVEHWGLGDPDSDGQLILYAGANGAVIDINDLAPHTVSTVATVSWPDGTITAIDDRYDCNEEWSGGCNAAIP